MRHPRFNPFLNLLTIISTTLLLCGCVTHTPKKSSIPNASPDAPNLEVPKLYIPKRQARISPSRQGSPSGRAPAPSKFRL